MMAFLAFAVFSLGCLISNHIKKDRRSSGGKGSCLSQMRAEYESIFFIFIYIQAHK